jgi:hypothetical protein
LHGMRTHAVTLGKHQIILVCTVTVHAGKVNPGTSLGRLRDIQDIGIADSMHPGRTGNILVVKVSLENSKFTFD